MNFYLTFSILLEVLLNQLDYHTFVLPVEILSTADAVLGLLVRVGGDSMQKVAAVM